MLSKFNAMLGEHTEEIIQAHNNQRSINIDFNGVMLEIEKSEDEDFGDYLQSLVLNLKEHSNEPLRIWLLNNLPTIIPEDYSLSVFISILVDLYNPEEIDQQAVSKLIEAIKSDSLDLVSFLNKTTFESPTTLSILKVALDNNLVSKSPEVEEIIKNHQFTHKGQIGALTTWIALMNSLGEENVLDQLKTNIAKPHYTLFTAVTTRTTYTEVFKANSLKKVIEAFADWYIDRYHDGDEDVLDLTYSENEGTLEVTNHSYDDAKTVDGSVEDVSHFAYYLRDWCNHGEEQVDIKITFNKVV